MLEHLSKSGRAALDLVFCFISADVGGTAGLFLGASLLTLMEVVEFAFFCALAFAKELTKNKSMKQVHVKETHETQKDDSFKNFSADDLKFGDRDRSLTNKVQN